MLGMIWFLRTQTRGIISTRDQVTSLAALTFLFFSLSITVLPSYFFSNFNPLLSTLFPWQRIVMSVARQAAVAALHVGLLDIRSAPLGPLQPRVAHRSCQRDKEDENKNNKHNLTACEAVMSRCRCLWNRG